MSAVKGKASRPALADVDLTDMPGSILQPDPEEVERRHTFARSLETPLFVNQSASAGMVKVVRPTSAVVSAVSENESGHPKEPVIGPTSASNEADTQACVPRRLRAEEPNLTVRLPEYVQQAVRMRAVAEKTTVRLIILRALRGAGFAVNEDDMTDDRGIVAKMRSRQK